MKVLEIKNNLVKIAFDSEDSIALGRFVIIQDNKNQYIAQIMNLRADNNDKYPNTAITKLLFTFDTEGYVKKHDGSIPSLSASVTNLETQDLLEIINIETPLILGSLAQQDINLSVDKTILENNLLICSNSLPNTVTLLSNITEQIKEKSVIIDTEGQFEWDRNIVIGEDFKLPLNQDTINFIYENDLEDVDAISKAVIQDIFIEIQKYIQSLPERFLPFDSFINVVDAQYRETQIPQLVLLKNKLLKYKELNIFAENLKDILDLSIAIENAKDISIDISPLPANLQKEVIQYIYRVLNGINEQIYCFVKVNNTNISKKLLKRYIQRDNVFTTVICPHEFKYIEEIKEVSQNYIFFTPLTVQHDFASYNTFLSKLNSDEFVVYGYHTNYTPFITELTIAEETETPNIVPMPETTNAPVETVEENTINNNEISNIPAKDFPEELDSEEEILIDEEVAVMEDETKDFSEISYPDIEDTELIGETALEETISQEEYLSSETETNYDEILPVDNILGDSVLEENVIYEPIVEPLEANNDYYQDEPSHDDMVEQVAKDVDKVFYEKLPTDDEVFDDTVAEELPNTIYDDSDNTEAYSNSSYDDIQNELTEDDLNLIDDLSVNEDITLIGSEPTETYDSYEQEDTPPVVPIYPSEDIEDSDIPTFMPGDRVSTAKFGEGIVEKMVPYGNKTLCSINFPEIGRRLLDPAITEITRVQ